MERVKTTLHYIYAFHKTIVLILTPILALPLPIFYPGPPSKCAFGIIVMAVYWMTEAIPMAATALLPIVLMPWLGVMSSEALCINYLKDTNMLFFGGLLVAVAVEKCNLHKRIALRVLSLVGSQPKWLMFGFMTVTAFLSMWISNTATTAMMIPIVHAVLVQLEDNKTERWDALDAEAGEAAANDIDGEETIRLHDKEEEEAKENTEKENAIPETEFLNTRRKSSATVQRERLHFENVNKALRLSVCFAANVGGTATLTGTAPNLVLAGIVDKIYGPDTGISFSSWFLLAFPNMLISLLAAWVLLIVFYLGVRELLSLFKCKRAPDPNREAVVKVIENEYKKLGPMSFAEIAVSIHFMILAAAWLTRDPRFISGWSDLLGPAKSYVTDASVGITVAVSLFMFPARKPNFLCFRSADDTETPCPAPSLLDWPAVHQRMAWNIILILGGGFALAESCKVSGLSSVIGNMLGGMDGMPPVLLILILCVITAIFTQVTTNTGTITIFLPILAELAAVLQVNPLYLMVPTTLASSFAFMLPVATPPNAIVFAYGNLKISDMVKSGFVMNVICILILMFSCNTWIYSYLHFGEYPAWAPARNASAVAAASAALSTTPVTIANISYIN